MAVKDVIQYYKECESQFKEFKEEMDDFKLLCSQGMVSPEVVENAQKMLAVVEDNYKKLSYVIFLLNKPVKKEKFNRYLGQNKKLMEKAITKNEVISQNNRNIQEMKNLTETLKNE